MPKNNVHLHLPPTTLADAKAKASSQGQTIEVYLASLITADLGQPAAADVATLIAAAPAIGGDTNGC